MRPRGPLVILLGAAALWAGGGCVFKGGDADPYRCGPGGSCAAGLECVDGICVTAPQADGGADGAEPDGPPDGSPDDGPGTADAQHDGPRQQDAAPGCVFDPLGSDLGTFTPVLASTTWQFGSGGYNQTYSEDLHLTWISGAGGGPVSMQVQVTLVAQGRPLFDTPNGNFASAGGVVLRASSLSATSVTGYFCGVDLRGQRLLLGRMSGAYSATHGNFTILGSQPLPSVAMNTPYLVLADATGGALTCTVGATTVSASDNTIGTGSVGLFTLGARARFTDAMYCVP
jgi:hypothetical protein